MGIEYFIKALQKAKAMDGKIIGEDGAFIKTELAENDRGAWINHMAEQYLKHEPIDDPPADMEIKMQDIVRELVKREIKKFFGK